MKILHDFNHVYFCGECDKPFQIKSKLNEHEKNHANEKPFKYDQCQKGFDSNTTMNRHKAHFHKSKTQNQTSNFASKRKNDLDPKKSHIRIEDSNIKKKDRSELKRKRGRKYDCQKRLLLMILLNPHLKIKQK